MTTQALVAEIEKLSHFEQVDVYKALYTLIFTSPSKLTSVKQRVWARFLLSKLTKLSEVK